MTFQPLTQVILEKTCRSRWFMLLKWRLGSTFTLINLWIKINSWFFFKKRILFFLLSVVRLMLEEWCRKKALWFNFQKYSYKDILLEVLWWHQHCLRSGAIFVFLFEDNFLQNASYGKNICFILQLQISTCLIPECSFAMLHIISWTILNNELNFQEMC